MKVSLNNQKGAVGPELLNGEFPLPKIGETLLTSGECAGGLYLTEFFLGRVFYR